MCIVALLALFETDDNSHLIKCWGHVSDCARSIGRQMYLMIIQEFHSCNNISHLNHSVRECELAN